MSEDDKLQNHSEQVAFDHLLFRGYEDVRHEPDGKVPPDFAVEGGIAVEVRRLNQNERGRATPKSLEETSIPFAGRLTSLLATFGQAVGM